MQTVDKILETRVNSVKTINAVLEPVSRRATVFVSSRGTAGD